MNTLHDTDLELSLCVVVMIGSLKIPRQGQYGLIHVAGGLFVFFATFEYYLSHSLWKLYTIAPNFQIRPDTALTKNSLSKLGWLVL